MTQQKTDSTNEARAQKILDAASDLIVHYGHDKTTMSDIAERAELTRAIVYLHFDSKERLFEALLYRETQMYIKTWLAALEAGPGSGTIAGVFRSALYAVHRSPFISALMKQDRRMFGKYLNKPGSIFASMQSSALWPETLRALQNAGAIRADIQPDVLGHIMNALAFGIIGLEDGKALAEGPSFDAIIEATADMMDRVLTPDDGGDQEAGKAIIQHITRAVQAQFEQGMRAGADQ